MSITDYLSGPLILVNSAALRHRLSGLLCNAAMRTIEEVRRARLAILVEEFGSYAEINVKLDRDRRDSTLSQIKNESVNSKGGAAKTMGSATAREIELACGKPLGWMDSDPDAWPFTSQLREAIATLDSDRIRRAENAVRTYLDMPVISPQTTENRRAA